MADRHNKLFPDGIKDEDVLKLAGALATLIQHPGWDIWEQHIYDRREETREELEVCDPKDIPRLQGASNALTGVLKAPQRILEHAKDVQDRLSEEGKLVDTVRVGYPDSDPAV